MPANLGTVIDTWMHPASAGAAIVSIVSLLLANALFSLLFATITQGLLPVRLRQTAALNVLALTVFGSLLPGVGPVLLLLLGVICPYLQKGPQPVPPRLLLRPTYASGIQSRFSYFGAGGALVRLRDARPGSPQGSRALLAVETLRNQESISLISDALSHSDETLRLLAHNLLAKREESIVGHMSRLEAQLGRKDHRNQARAMLELAELHLEFLYLGFVTGSLKAMHLDAAQRLLDALGEPPESVPWHTRFKVLRARLRRQYGVAGGEALIRQDYEQALSAGAAPARALPWLLEQAWHTRDYARIHELLARHRLYAQIPLIGPVAERWERSRP